MAHLAFVAPLFLGHLNPVCALARELNRRGHRTTFVQMPDAAPLLARRGLDFQEVGRATHPPGFLAAQSRDLARLNGPFGAGPVVRQAASVTDMLCRELPEALRALQADMLVCDQVEAAGGLVADRLGLPHVSVASALPINREPKAPPIYVPWRYDPSPWGVRRNRIGQSLSTRAMRPICDVIAVRARDWSLGPRRRIDHCLSRLLQVAQLVPGLDVPREQLAPVFHYCGPFRAPSDIASGPELPRDGRPLAYAALGSLPGSRRRLFRRIAKAAQRSGVQLVLTHAGGLTAAQAARLPGRPAAFDVLPQHEVLSQAAVAVLHGGLNTVLDAAAHGVPMVVMPITFEQGAIAIRVERSGAGRIVSRWRPTAGPLHRAIRRVLDDPAHAEAAARLRDEIAAAGGVRRAADLVETALRTGRPVPRD